MSDQYGRFDLQDGLQIYGALRGIQNDQRKDEEYRKRLAEEQQYKQHLGAMQKDESYQPDMSSPGYDPEAYNKAVLRNTGAVLSTDEAKSKRDQIAQQRVELQRQNIARGAGDALAIYQTDPQAGTIAMLKTYDSLHDGIELVKDDNGNPLIDEQGQITLKGINGGTTKSPIPPMNDMIKMAQMYTDPKNIQKADAMASDAYRAHNASQFAKAKHFKDDNGNFVIMADEVYDPVSRTKNTVLVDLKTGQPIDPADFAQGNFREISHDSTEKFEQAKALKGIEHGYDMEKVGAEYGYRANLERTKARAENKGGVGSAEANRELNVVLSPFSKGPVVDEFGEITQDGKSAIQRAQEIHDSYNGKKGLTLTQQRELDQSKRALRAYSNMNDQVMSRWGGSGGQQREGGGSGAGAQDNDANVVLARLVEMGLSKEAIQVEMVKRFPGIKIQDATSAPAAPGQVQQGAALGGQPAQQAPTQSNPAQQQASSPSGQRIKAEFQELALKYGKDKAKEMIIQKYPNAMRR